MAHILVVDDDGTNRRTIRRILELDGHEVEEFGDGTPVLARMAVREPDLVVSDVYMPDFDGIELLNALGAAHPDVPMILVSGGSRQSHGHPVLDDAAQLGATVTLRKPLSMNELRDAVGQVLGPTDTPDPGGTDTDRRAPFTGASSRRFGHRSQDLVDFVDDLFDSDILIVDDDPSVARATRRVLEAAGYTNVTAVHRGDDAFAFVDERSVDLLLLDVDLGGQDGLMLLDQLRWGMEGRLVPDVVVITGSSDLRHRDRAFSMGAKDFLAKPADASEVLARVRNVLTTRLLHRSLARHGHELESRVAARTQDLYGLKLELLDRLSRVAEYRDDITGGHQQRVGALAALVAAAIGEAPDRVELIRRAAPLHDIGKVAIPDAILLKPGPLTEEEYEVMKTHTLVGARMLRDGGFPLLRTAETIALTHHEKWDGTGYPLGLSATEIPIESRVTSVVDVFDSLTSARPYRTALPTIEAIEELERCSGTFFDPSIVPVIRYLWENDRLSPMLEAHPHSTVSDQHRTDPLQERFTAEELATWRVG